MFYQVEKVFLSFSACSEKSVRPVGSAQLCPVFTEGVSRRVFSGYEEHFPDSVLLKVIIQPRTG